MGSKLNEDAREFFRKQGARGGKLGAKARMEKLTPEQRTEYARIGGRNRWKKNGTAAALETESDLAESQAQTKKEKS
jgi:hypothetical protein